MDGQLISKKAKTFWEKARFTYNNYQAYLKKKQDRFKLDIVDLLFVSNFKAGNGNIQEDEESVELKLIAYSSLLQEINQAFRNEKLNLGELDTIELDQLYSFLEKLMKICQENRIDGFGISYSSALFSFYFPDLIPILDRRILMGTEIVNKPEQMNSVGQVIKIENYYKDLIIFLHKDLVSKKFSKIKDADKAYFIIETPEKLKLRNSRRLKLR